MALGLGGGGFGDVQNEDSESTTQSASASLNALGLLSSQTGTLPSSSGLLSHEEPSHDPGSHPAAGRAIQILDDQNQSPYVYSPDTIASELLTADLASTRWLDLLAFDAARADKGFSLAPTRHTSPVEGLDALHYADRDGQATRPQVPLSSGYAAGSRVDVPQAVQAVQHTENVDTAVESLAWQLEEDISLQGDELRLFRNFAERAALWMDLFDPLKHFATHATRLAVSLHLQRQSLCQQKHASLSKSFN